MRVQKVHVDSEFEFELLDDEGLAIPIVSSFLGYLRARGCSPNTLCAYAHDLQHFYKFLKGASIQYQHFTPRRTLDFLQYLRVVPSRRKARKHPSGIDCGAAPQLIPQLAPTTVNRILAAVSTFYEYVILTDVVSDGENPLRKIPDIATARVVPRYTPFLSLTTKQHPVRRVVRVRTAQRLPRPLTDEQVTRLFSSLTRRRDKAMFLLMLQGGLRPGEVLNLHLEDVQYGRRRVTVRHRIDHPKGARTKSSVERVVDLHEPETLATVSAYMLHERPSDTSATHLFLVGGNGSKRHEPLGYAALVRLFRRHCQRLGFHEPWVTPHALRHTHATKMWESGMRELTLQKRLGHASPESIRMYTRVSDAAMLEDYHRAVKRAEKDGEQLRVLLNLQPPQPRFQHVTSEEYGAFTRQRPTIRSGNNLLKAYRRFIYHYPDLEQWFQAPLAERIGQTKPRSGKAYVSAVARPYLYYLARTGELSFDWQWIIGVHCHVLPDELLPPEVTLFIRELVDEGVRIGYKRRSTTAKLSRIMKALYLHHLAPGVTEISDGDVAAFEDAIVAFGQRPDLETFFDSAETYRRVAKQYRQAIYSLRLVLYHRGRIAAPPDRTPSRPERVLLQPRMNALLERYLWARRVQYARPATITKIGCDVRRFIHWLSCEHPHLESFSEVTRDHVLSYSASLETALSPRTARPLTVESKITRLSSLSVFFQDTTAWGWEDAPLRPLLGARDLPKRPKRIPRYIPAEQLNKLLPAVRELVCPFQRAALIIARWSGARRSEIRNLDLDCLDAYPDGTARLRIPVGKGKSERLVPLHEEAAAAIRDLQQIAVAVRGFRDDQTGAETRRLFVHRGLLLSASYLFETALERACTQAGLIDQDGKPMITAHRFRHTVGTELAEGGARLHTIMKMLGHTSTEMTLVYAHISDKAMAEDYQKVLGPGAELAGPLAEQLRTGVLPEESVEWLKKNFFKTELELGHCLRLPQEGPCECDLYLTCAKFVTTREYAPRLRSRRLRELELIEDAISQGWDREVERHRCATKRIEQLLEELGEPLEMIDEMNHQG